ncbi:MAG: c-type cytochrome, partial [Tistlia sp.]
TRLLSGGADEVARLWDLASGEELGVTVAAGPSPLVDPLDDDESRGAALFRKCAICHTVEPGSQNRAGPTLHGLFGREAGAVEDYRYSDALKHKDIVWTDETVSRLFELGPDVYVPGTKMPMQLIPDPGDRRALMTYLKRVTEASKN